MLQDDGENVFVEEDTLGEEEVEDDTTTDSPPEDKHEEDEPESETGGEGEDEEPEPETKHAEVPFHEHPRWKEVYGELKDLREFKEKTLPLISALEKDDEPEEVPSWFSSTFGGDEDTWRQYRNYSRQERKAIRDEILSEIEQKQSQIKDEAKKWDDFVDNKLGELEAEGLGKFKTDKHERSALIKIALDYLPSDKEGNIDFRKAYEIYKLQKSKGATKPKADPQKEIRKKVASQITEKPKGEGEKKDYLTPDDFKGRGIHDFLHN